MGWGTPDPYNDPEDFGLRIIACIDLSDGYYQFDYFVVWEEIETGRLFYGEDSGCSCPAPFEDVKSIADLTPVGSHDEILSRAEYRLEDTYYDSEKVRVQEEISSLRSKLRDLRKNK